MKIFLKKYAAAPATQNPGTNTPTNQNIGSNTPTNQTPMTNTPVSQKDEDKNNKSLDSNNKPLDPKLESPAFLKLAQLGVLLTELKNKQRAQLPNNVVSALSSFLTILDQEVKKLPLEKQRDALLGLARFPAISNIPQQMRGK